MGPDRRRHAVDDGVWDAARPNNAQQAANAPRATQDAPSAQVAAAAAAQARKLSCTVASGREDKCTSHVRFDGEGRQWPISITVLTPPASGKITTRIIEEATKNGQQVRAIAIFYQSKPGFVGQDSFTYQRRSDDASDPLNVTHAMSVTVK
jgi:hypothetical protein